MIIDRYLSLPKSYSYITQEFGQSTYEKLVELLPEIKKYNELIFLYKRETEIPQEAYRGYEKFIEDYKIKGETEVSYEEGQVRKGSAYFVMNDDFLWRLLKDCRDQQIVVGSDIGIIGHDDSLVKEMMAGGITTISTDFPLMGKLSAECVNKRNKVQLIVPTYLNKRNSI